MEQGRLMGLRFISVRGLLLCRVVFFSAPAPKSPDLGSDVQIQTLLRMKFVVRSRSPVQLRNETERREHEGTGAGGESWRDL